MYDPQKLSFAGKVKALVALGRIPLGSEVPLWTMFGCIVASRTFGSSDGTASFDFLTALQCMLVTWGDNISINYGNEFFDYEMDKPGQEAVIKREVERRKELALGKGEKGKRDGLKRRIELAGVIGENGQSDPMNRSNELAGGREEEGKSDGVVNGEALSHSHPTTTPKPSTKKELNEKIMGNTTRILHDGTFPPWTALALSMFVQSLVFAMILYSRHLDPTLNPSSTSTRHTPFKGLALWIGIISTILSHEYVAPPLRLHYRGWGEIISALFLSPVSAVWGLTGYYTAINPAARTISFADLFFAPTIGSFGIDKTLWIMLAAMYCTEQARVLIMHVHDIDADIAGGKITAVVRMGYVWASRAYVGLNVVGVMLWGALIRRLVKGKGAMLGGIGMWGIKAGSERSMEAVGKGWATGVGIVLAYSIPIMVLTAVSLFAHVPDRPKSTKTGIIPIVPHMELVKLVSLQLLSTPVVLSIAVVLAGRA